MASFPSDFVLFLCDVRLVAEYALRGATRRLFTRVRGRGILRDSAANSRTALILGHGAMRRPGPSVGRAWWVPKVR
jgi:hypothetical protein